MYEDTINSSARYRKDIDLLENNSSHRKIVSAVANETQVLDVGCACGDLGVYLSANKKCKMYGIEYSKDSVMVARRTGAYNKIIQADLNCFLPEEYFSEEMFDVIVFGDILEHLYSPQKVLAKFIPLLKNDGKILLSLPNISHGSIAIQIHLNKFEYMDFGLLDDTHIRFFTYQSMASMVSSVGLKIEHSDQVIYDIEGLHSSKHLCRIPINMLHRLAKDKHKFIFQYVVVLRPADNAGIDLLNHNLNALNEISFDASKIIFNLSGKYKFHRLLCRKFFEFVKDNIKRIFKKNR